MGKGLVDRNLPRFDSLQEALKFSNIHRRSSVPFYSVSRREVKGLFKADFIDRSRFSFYVYGVYPRI